MLSFHSIGFIANPMMRHHETQASWSATLREMSRLQKLVPETKRSSHYTILSKFIQNKFQNCLFKKLLTQLDTKQTYFRNTHLQRDFGCPKPSGECQVTLVCNCLSTGFHPSFLSTAVFCQRFGFFYLVKCLHEVFPWWTPKQNFLKFRSQDFQKIHF